MAPIFVGSNSDDTRIRSNRVGLAASTSDPGSASEGDIYYDSTNNQVKTYDGSSWSAIQGSGTVELVASGSLSNGATVVINTDGTVGIVTETTSDTPSAGTPVVYESAETSYTSAVYDSTNGKVVIAYRDGGNSNYGTAIVGTVSGNSISFGSAVVFESAATKYISATYDSTNSKVIIAYQDEGYPGPDYGTAIVGTVSGTSISFGSPAVFESARTFDISAVYDSTNQKVVIAYEDGGNSDYGTAIVGTVSGTSISFGSPAVFNSEWSQQISTVYDSSNGKIVIVYRDFSNNAYGTAIVATVSGTSISFGSSVAFNSDFAYDFSTAYDSTNGKVVIAYRDGDNSDYGTAIVGTVSGTSISFGTPVVFESANSQHTSSVFDSTNQKVVIAYRDNGNSNYGTVISGTVSGTSISFGSPVVFESADTSFTSSVYDSTNGKVVTAYDDNGNSSYGTAVIISNTSTNLTSENFIGFSDAAYSDGDTANIQIISSIDDAQSGLTTGSKFYVQNDGTLGTTAGDPSVLAGTAISGTEILIKQ